MKKKLLLPVALLRAVAACDQYSRSNARRMGKAALNRNRLEALSTPYGPVSESSSGSQKSFVIRTGPIKHQHDQETRAGSKPFRYRTGNLHRTIAYPVISPIASSLTAQHMWLLVPLRKKRIVQRIRGPRCPLSQARSHVA